MNDTIDEVLSDAVDEIDEVDKVDDEIKENWIKRSVRCREEAENDRFEVFETTEINSEGDAVGGFFSMFLRDIVQVFIGSWIGGTNDTKDGK